MKPIRRYFVYLIVPAILMYSCGTGKQLVTDLPGERLSEEEHFRAVIQNTPSFNTLTSRIRMTLPVEGKTKSVNGTLKIDRDKLIQISLVAPVIRTEGARIEITPDRVLAIDRVNHRYAEAPVSEFLSLLPAGSDYNILQSLFTNAVFIPGQDTVSADQLSKLEPGKAIRNWYVREGASEGLMYSFHTTSAGNRLRETVIADVTTNALLRWKYNEFVDAGGTVFPSVMDFTIEDSEAASHITMELTRIAIDKNEIRPASAPRRYEKVRLQDIMQMIEAL